MKRIFIEINGIRYRRVVKRKRVPNICDECDISRYCTRIIGSPCLDGNEVFKDDFPSPLEMRYISRKELFKYNTYEDAERAWYKTNKRKPICGYIFGDILKELDCIMIKKEV